MAVIEKWYSLEPCKINHLTNNYRPYFYVTIENIEDLPDDLNYTDYVIQFKGFFGEWLPRSNFNMIGWTATEHVRNLILSNKWNCIRIKKYHKNDPKNERF